MDEATLEPVVRAIAGARRTMLYGCGREGLMMRALAMRLHHLGLEVCVQGDMTAFAAGSRRPVPVRRGAGLAGHGLGALRRGPGGRRPGHRRDGGAGGQHRQAGPRAPGHPGADDGPRLGGDSVLPMGSLFEGAMFVVFEVLVLRLRDVLGETAETDAGPPHQHGVNRPGFRGARGAPVPRYLMAPADMPRTMKRSSRTPTMMSGRMAANEMAAMRPPRDALAARLAGHHDRQGDGRRGRQQRREEVLVPGEHERQDERRDHARQGDGQDDRWRTRPRRPWPSTRAASSSSVGMVMNWSRMIQMTMGSTRQRVQQDQPDVRVQQRQLLVEHQERQGQDHRRQDELADEEERDVGVLHVPELVAEARQPVAGQRAQEHGQAGGRDGHDGRVHEARSGTGRERCSQRRSCPATGPASASPATAARSPRRGRGGPA